MFKKALVLSCYNWKVMLKALICQVLILAFIVAICFLMFGGLVEDCIQVISTVDFNSFLSDTITSIVDGNFDTGRFADNLDEIINEIRSAMEAFPNILNRVEISYLESVLLFLLYRLLVSFSDVAAACEIQEFMTSCASRPFLWYFVKKFRESLKFVLLQLVISVPLDLFIIIISIGMTLALSVFMGWWTAIPVAIIVLILYAGRQTYFAFWLPTIATEEMDVSKALTKSVATIPYRFWNVFWKTLLLVVIMVACVVLSVMYVQNDILKLVVIFVPDLILFFLMKCINFVEYFEATNRPYFYKKVDVEGTDSFNKKAERLARRQRRAKNN